VAAGADAPPFAASQLHDGGPGNTAAGTLPDSGTIPASMLAGCTGLEPVASGVTDGAIQLVTHGQHSQSEAITDGEARRKIADSPGFAGIRTPRVTPGLQAQRVSAVPSEGLLSVREVAARLGVSTSTVYKLCAERKLPHVRVSNAIRVDPKALEGSMLGLGRARWVRHRATYSAPVAQRCRLGQRLLVSPCASRPGHLPDPEPTTGASPGLRRPSAGRLWLGGARRGRSDQRRGRPRRVRRTHDLRPVLRRQGSAGRSSGHPRGSCHAGHAEAAPQAGGRPRGRPCRVIRACIWPTSSRSARGSSGSPRDAATNSSWPTRSCETRFSRASS